MSETFACGGCNLEIPFQIPDFSNHYFNLCAGEIFHQCQIGDCMQYFSTQWDLYEHGEIFHPEVDFYEETFVILSEQIADAFCRENFITLPETEQINYEKQDLTKKSSNKCRINLKTASYKLNSFCDSCGKKVKRPCLLDSHLKKCLDKRFRPFQCTYENCKSTFTTKDHKRRHENTVHKLPVKCPYENCDINLKPFSLKGHVERFHSNEKRVDLFHEKCDKSVELEKVFSCLHENCGAIFATNRRLLQHMRYVHQPPKKCPYEWCNIFVKPMNLRQHIIGVHEKLEKLCQRCNKWIMITNFYSHIKICNKTEKVN